MKSRGIIASDPDQLRTQPAPELDTTAADAEALLPEIAEGEACLLVRNGSEAGTAYRLVPSVVVGRHPLCDIVLSDITVSRHHVELEKTDVGFVVTDLGSLNGTYVNGVRVDRAALASGDAVQIGRFKFVFVCK